jgi:hypothetical protein
MHMVVAMIVILHKGEIVIMGMAAMAEADTRHEFMRLGDLIYGFEIAAAIDESEGAAGAVRPLGHYGHILRSPSVPLLGADAPAWRDAVLEDLHGDHAMAGIDAPNVFTMAMTTMMVVPMARLSLLWRAAGPAKCARASRQRS